MEIVGLDHVQLAIPRAGIDEARAFYGGVLGLPEEKRPWDDPPGIWYRAPGTILHIGVEDPHTPAKKAHPALLVTDLDVARAELEAAGARTKDAEGARFHTFDPFGNRIEIVQAGEGFSER